MYRLANGRITGVPNREFTPEDASLLGSIIGTWLGKGSIMVSGRDYNPASRMLKRAIISGLMSVGVDVMDFHEAIGGEISYSIRRFGATGGFIIAYNPWIKDNALVRIYRSPGAETIGNRLMELAEKKEVDRVDPGETGWVTYAEYIHKLYVSSITSFIKHERIRRRRLRIVVDVAHGPLDKVLPDLFSSLNIDYILINSSKPLWSHQQTYPYIEGVKKVAGIVRSINADLGAVFSPDGADLLVIDDHGRPLLPEETLLLLTLGMPKDAEIMTGRECFGFIGKAADRLGVKVSKTMGGEEEFFSEVVSRRPYIGSNCMGGYILPIFSLGYDAVLAFAKIIESISLGEGRSSSIMRKHAYPKYYTIETALQIDEISEKLDQVAERVYSFIGGYRFMIEDTGIVAAYDPIINATKILIDAYSPNAGRAMGKIQTLLQE